MKGQLLIDGIDIYAVYGVCTIKGSYDNLVAFPPMKELDKNDWPEEDGQEFDLSNPALNTSEVSLEFAFKDDLGFGALIDILSDMGYHDFLFPLLGRTYRLRLSSQNSYSIYQHVEIAKITFSNDFPRESDYIYQEPINSIPLPKGYEIDDKDLSDYGIAILKGSNAEILKASAIKKNLLQNFKYQDGAVYDGEYVKFQTKEVALKCLMSTPDVSTFWRNRDAFLHDLTKLSAKTDEEGYEYLDVERIFYCEEFFEHYPCYYKNCKTTNFILMNGGVWWEFTLKLVFTGFRTKETDYMLAAESGELIITENNEYYIELI